MLNENTAVDRFVEANDLVIHPHALRNENAMRGESDIRILTGQLAADARYRQSTLSLTASENHPSLVTRTSGSGLQGSFYHFAPPYPTQNGEWSFPDCGAMANIASQLSSIGCSLFEAETFDWRPNGGSVAEQAIMLGTCQRGDAMCHFAHQDGGHFALEDLARVAGIQIFHVPVDQRTLLIDVHALKQMIKAYPQIKLVMLDQSFKLRWQPLFEIRQALGEQIVLSYDASHDGGLIAGGVLPQPLLQGADIIHGNTHKTIAGPQKAYIAFRDRHHAALKKVSDWVAPHLQSNCHQETLVPMALSLLELSVYGRDYARQVVANARAFAVALRREGFEVAGESFGFTETHQVHVVLGSPQAALEAATKILPSCGIRANNIQVPGYNGSHGLRFGTQAATRRGLKEGDFADIAMLLAKVLLRGETSAHVQSEIEQLALAHPLFPLHYSFDQCMGHESMDHLMREVLS